MRKWLCLVKRFFFKGLANEKASIFQTRSEYFKNTSSEHNRFWVGVGSRCLLSTRIPTVSKKIPENSSSQKQQNSFRIGTFFVFALWVETFRRFFSLLKLGRPSGLCDEVVETRQDKALHRGNGF